MLQSLWVWAILGLVLLSIEMLSGTFYILWFGISALCVAAMLSFYPQASLALQLLAFSMLSIISLGLWRRNYKTKSSALRVGQSRDDSIGKVGIITSAASTEQNGKIQFTVPVMGSREWVVIADEPVAPGERAVVVGIEGNYLRVRRSDS